MLEAEAQQNFVQVYISGSTECTDFTISTERDEESI